jgi:cytochrome b561
VVLAALHWLLALLIIAMLCAGFFLLVPMPNVDPQKIGIPLVHMSLGMLILGLTIVRFIVRRVTAKPADATTGYAALDRTARFAHYVFYLLVVLMAATGLATAILAGLNRSVFQKTGEAMPATFSAYPTFTAHFYLALFLAGLIAAHVAAALYHQFARGDRRCGECSSAREIERAGTGEVVQPNRPITSRRSILHPTGRSVGMARKPKLSQGSPHAASG